MRKILNKRGFTLIELMIVVTIIGLLSALAIPNYLQFQSMAKQAEAKSNLGGIFTNEQAYYGEHSKYTAVITETGFSILTNAKYYDFTVSNTAISTPTDQWYGKNGNPGAGPPAGTQVAFDSMPGASTTAFTALALGNLDNDPPFDAWSITSEGHLTNEYDDSKRATIP